MSQTPPDQADDRRAFRPLPWLLAAAATIAVAIVFFAPSRQIADVRLDPSNYASYAYFTAKDFQYGKDVVPMAGPYGFVPYGSTYAGHLFWKRFPLELLTKLVFGVLVVWFMHRARERPLLRWLWLATLLVMTPLVEDLPYDLAILLAGLCLVECHVAAGRRSLAIAAGLAAYLALLTLFKGTQAMLAVATLGLLGLQAVIRNDFRRLPWIIGAYLVALVALLAAAGQNPLNLPQFLHGILELSSGYNAAMVLEEPRAAFLTGAGALLALELLVVLVLLPRWRQPAILAGGLLLAGFTFVEWKHGFVRADGHVFIFYHYAAIAALTIPLFAGPAPAPGWNRLLAGGLALAAFSLGVWADGAASLLRHVWAVRQLPSHGAAALRQILAPAAEKSRLDAAYTVQRERFELPLVRETIGPARIDFFGTELGYLILNRFNYRPRPMGGGTFNVFTPWLQDRNTAYLADPATRPEFYLVSPQTIDHRFLAQDDPGTLRALLELYSPVAAEQGLVLFRARSGSPALSEPRLLGTQTVTLDQPVTPPSAEPGEIVLVSFTLPPSLLGRLRAFLYKPALVFMDLEGAGIANARFRRVVPNLFRNPVPLNPVIEDIQDVLALYRGDPGKIAQRFTLHTGHPSLLAAEKIEAHFYAARRPAPVPAVAARLAELVRFTVANVAPVKMVPANAPPRQFDGQSVQMLEPPGLIRFPLLGEEKEIRFKFGLDPEAYTATGLTDGVEFMVELEPPGKPPHTLFRRWLRPRTEPGDRGTQAQRVVLPPFPAGSTLALRTGPGADGDGAWDWAYYTNIRLLGGTFLPEQFPRFGRLPLTVEAAVAGALHHEGRDLFMLNSPGSLTFALQESDRKLVFTAGLLAGAYTNGGESDGVEFTVDLRHPDGTGVRIFQRLVNPRDVAGDRGDVSFTIPLPAIAPGTRLMLTASPGPAGSNAWDWSYVESLHFE